MRRFGAAVLALAALSCGKPAPFGPAWTPDPAAAAKLGAPVEVGSYQLSLPPGLQPAPAPTTLQAGVQVFAFQGPPRPDRTTASLAATVWAASPEEAKESALEASLLEMTAGIGRRREDFVRKPVEQGTVNGLPFVRLRWTGTEPTRKIPMGGIAYLGLEGPNLVYLNTQDAEPHLAEALALGEAAILSFRRK